MGLTSCLLRDEVCKWREEVGHYLGVGVVVAMSCTDFVMRFRAKSAPNIDIQPLAREFQDLRKTTKIVVEIIAKFR